MDLPTPEHAPIVLAREPGFRLGAAEVRPGAREVATGRRTETLEPRVMQVLVALARAEGAILTRDDLIASCWEGRVVSEDAITRVISRLRRLSEEMGPDSFALETITKVGYRLLPAGHIPAAAVAVAPAHQPKSRRALIVSGGLVGAAAVAGVGGWAWWRSHNRVSPRAQQLYELALEAVDKNTHADNAQAVGFLKEAVTDSPDYADAWGALALAYRAGMRFAEPAQQAGIAAQAKAAAQRALELDPNQRDALTTLALMTPIFHRWAEAEGLMVKALRQHPREPRLEIAYALLLASVGRARESLPRAQVAAAEAPFVPYHRYGLASALWMVGRIEEAERIVRDALKLWPRQYSLWFRLFYLLSHTGRADQAIAMAEDVANWPLGIDAENVRMCIAPARAMLTRTPADIEVAARQELEVAQRGVGYAENAIDWLSGMGRVDDAFRVLNALYFGEGFAIDERRFRNGDEVRHMARDRATVQLFMPATANVRADPRFARLVSRIGLSGYWQATGKRPDPEIWRPPT